jgi:hypothetical protein
MASYTPGRMGHTILTYDTCDVSAGAGFYRCPGIEENTTLSEGTGRNLKWVECAVKRPDHIESSIAPYGEDLSSTQNATLHTQPTNWVCLNDHSLFPTKARDMRATHYGKLAPGSMSYDAMHYPMLAAGPRLETSTDNSATCRVWDSTVNFCNAGLVGYESTCPTKPTLSNWRDTCAFETQLYIEANPAKGNVQPTRGGPPSKPIDTCLDANTYGFCSKIQWDRAFQQPCCLTGTKTETAWNPPSSHADAVAAGEESFTWYCDPAWNTKDPLGACAEVMRQTCTGSAVDPNDANTTGSKLLYEPACSEWYQQLLEDTQFAVLGNSSTAIPGVSSQDAIATSLGLRWAAVEGIIADYCTSADGRDRPECACYLSRGAICRNVPPDEPCSFVHKTTSSTQGTTCGEYSRANLMSSNDDAALSLVDFVCLGGCEPPPAYQAAGALLDRAQYTRKLACPPDVCFQVINECISVGKVQTEGLVDIGDTIRQCRGNFATLPAASPQLFFSVQHLSPYSRMDGKPVSGMTTDGTVVLDYEAVTADDGSIVQDPILNGSRLMGQFMVSNAGGSAANLNSMDAWYVLPGANTNDQKKTGLPPWLTIQVPSLGAGVSLEAAMQNSTTVPVPGGGQLETVWYAELPPLGVSGGSILLSDTTQPGVSVRLDWVMTAAPGAAAVPQQPGSGQAFNPGTPPDLQQTLETPGANSAERLLKTLGMIVLAFAGLAVLAFVYLLWRQQQHGVRASP